MWSHCKHGLSLNLGFPRRTSEACGVQVMRTRCLITRAITRYMDSTCQMESSSNTAGPSQCDVAATL
ncbi:hypothetical protein ABKN59_008765 [Abortiporus biennis]